jgi:DNA-binding response OmpR family regulator
MVLLVALEPDLASACSRRLRDAGHPLAEVRAPDEAIALARGTPPDVVLIDGSLDGHAADLLADGLAAAAGHQIPSIVVGNQDTLDEVLVAVDAIAPRTPRKRRRHLVG